MAKKIFVTGTDTDAGKTYISTGLLKLFNQHHYTTLGLKPIASGCQRVNGILHNTDALSLQKVSTIKLNYSDINPYAFEPAIAPHIAAHQMNCKMSVKDLIQKTKKALDQPADICIIEGAGGWYVPINESETLADYAKEVGAAVLLVVRIKLGCINHAILTHKAIRNDNLPILGWIANCMDPVADEKNEIIDTLKHWLDSPLLGALNQDEKVEESSVEKHFVLCHPAGSA